MPRITLNPMFDGLSGRLKEIVFCKKSMSPKGKDLRQGYMRGFTSGVQRSIIQQNNREAFRIVTEKYNTIRLIQSVYSSWVGEAHRLSSQYTITPRSLFYTFFLDMWQASSSGLWKPADLALSGGFDLWGWENRFLISWI
ncbi:MAG: hypothetical protein IEMM0008_1787 [bacterium]|nr:MAG: hypothetical protein IEMM0008_1787 [bacterium]